MSDERRYTPILDWCERWVTDEAKGIRELKEDNYELYKKSLEALENKYRLIIYGRFTEEEIPVRIRDYQLQGRLGELIWQYRTAENQDKKDSIKADIKEVVSERYDLDNQLRTIQLQGLQRQIERLQQSVQFYMSQIDMRKDPNFAKVYIDGAVEGYCNPRPFGDGQRGRGGGRRPPPGFTISDANDPNSNHMSQ